MAPVNQFGSCGTNSILPAHSVIIPFSTWRPVVRELTDQGAPQYKF